MSFQAHTHVYFPVTAGHQTGSKDNAFDEFNEKNDKPAHKYDG